MAEYNIAETRKMTPYEKGEWMEGGRLHIGDVTHWMPLPQPPKGE